MTDVFGAEIAVRAGILRGKRETQPVTASWNREGREEDRVHGLREARAIISPCSAAAALASTTAARAEAGKSGVIITPSSSA